MAKKSETRQPETPAVAAREVPLKWKIPDSLITRYASHMTVQAIEDMFKVSFFEAKPDIVLKGGQLQSEVTAECVASIVIHPKKLVQFALILEQVLKDFQIGTPTADDHTKTSI